MTNPKYDFSAAIAAHLCLIFRKQGIQCLIFTTTKHGGSDQDVSPEILLS